MAKRLFLLFLIASIGVICSPRGLMATDSFVSGAPVFDAVETVAIEEPEPEPEAPVVAAPAAGYAPQIMNYTVTIQSGEMVAHGLSYGDIYKTGRLVYGHNSSNLLGNLVYRSIGETISVTEGGVTQNYQVVNMVTYEKTADGYLNNDPYLMGDITYTAMGYDIALMTCAGVSYGNGDASHRLVVYANAV